MPISTVLSVNVPSRLRCRIHHRNDRLVTSSKQIAKSQVHARNGRVRDASHQKVETMMTPTPTVVALKMPLNSSQAERCSTR